MIKTCTFGLSGALSGWPSFAATLLFCAGAVSASVSQPKVGNVEPELLAPEHAFGLSAQRKRPNEVVLEYRIAEGYYMYRNKFRIALEPEATGKLGKAKYPKGKLKTDATFGRVETYRGSVRILLPLTLRRKAIATQLKIRVTSQGCADVGICFPPLQQLLTFALEPGDTSVVLPDGDVVTGGFSKKSSVDAESNGSRSGSSRVGER
jgi:thioredoxin:protein disulfide reductase